jgi:hypothetical protein
VGILACGRVNVYRSGGGLMEPGVRILELKFHFYMNPPVRGLLPSRNGLVCDGDE